MYSKELIRGTLKTIILNLLSENGKMYGYEITQKVKILTDSKIKLTEGALYPTLHKLEAEGFVKTSSENLIQNTNQKVEFEIVKRSEVYIRSADSILDPSGFSAVSGIDGNVQESGVIIQDGNLVVLPESLLDADSYLPERCAVKLDGDYSSLIVVGRGGVPLTPGEYIPAYQLSGDDWDEWE